MNTDWLGIIGGLLSFIVPTRGYSLCKGIYKYRVLYFEDKYEMFVASAVFNVIAMIGDILCFIPLVLATVICGYHTLNDIKKDNRRFENVIIALDGRTIGQTTVSPNVWYTKVDVYHITFYDPDKRGHIIYNFLRGLAGLHMCVCLCVSLFVSVCVCVCVNQGNAIL